LKTSGIQNSGIRISLSKSPGTNTKRPPANVQMASTRQTYDSTLLIATSYRTVTVK
jgi:hypothetical protein